MAEKQKVQIAVPANLKYSLLIRHVAGEVFLNAHFEKAWVSRLKLVVDELFMNAVRYGSTEDTSTVYLTFLFDEESMAFSIEDDGTGKQAVSPEELKAKIQQNEQNTDLTRTSGRGLSMITNQWTDSSEITRSEHGGINITIFKSIETSPPSPPQVPTWAEKTIPAKAKEQPTQVAPASKDSMVKEVQVSGELDHSNVEAKIAPISHQVELMGEGSVLVIDFKDATYINSTFIGSLAAWHTHLQHKKGKIQLKNMNQHVREVLSLVGLLKVIEEVK